MTHLPLPPPGKAARNEQRKLKSTSLNAIGLASFGLGVLTPLFSGAWMAESLIQFAAGAVVGYTFHELAKGALAELED